MVGVNLDFSGVNKDGSVKSLLSCNCLQVFGM